MRNVGQIIKDILKERRLMQKDLANALDMSPQNLSSMLNKPIVDCLTLERVCEWLQLDPADFFDYRPCYAGSTRQNTDIAQSVVIGSAEVTLSEPYQISHSSMLDKLLASYEARIKTLEETNSILRALLTENK